MELKCISSGSSGNCYILTADNGEVLILDCGVPISDIEKGLNWNIRNVVGCVVTHVHKDHSMSIKKLRDIGIKVIAPYENNVTDVMHFTLGGYDIQAFDVPHNGTPNYGFYIKTPPREQRILYMTDLEYCKYSFKKQCIDHMLIECNYIKDLVDKDLPQYEHKVLGHCELETTKGIVSASATKDLQNVILCHLGKETSDKDRMIAEVQKIVPWANVDVAGKGKEWILRKCDECPF